MECLAADCRENRIEENVNSIDFNQSDKWFNSVC